MTSKDIFTSIVSKDENTNTITKKLINRLNGVIHTCFKKIRIREDKSDNDIVKLFDKRRKLRSKVDKYSQEKLKQAEEELADKCADANYEKIKNELKDIDCEDGGFNIGRLWKLRKKLSPYRKETPTAILDPKGNLVTSAKGI